MVFATVFVKLKYAVINLIVFDIDEHSLNLASSKQLDNPPSRTSTQVSTKRYSYQNSQKLTDQLPISSQTSGNTNFIPPTTESATQQKGSSGLDTSAGGSRNPADHSRHRKLRCKIVHLTKKCKLRSLFSSELVSAHTLSTVFY